MTNRYGIPDPPPKTVYRTPNPERGISEAYEIAIEPVPGAPDPRRCWIVRELHGYYEEATKTYHEEVETLHPNEPQHFLALEEAMREADKQVLFRAKEGFHFLFIRNEGPVDLRENQGRSFYLPVKSSSMP
jgi:hypothetical protein